MSEKVYYVKSSLYMMWALKSFGDFPKMPSEIARDSGIYQNHISNMVKQLKEHELVECIGPEVCKGRLYRLTLEGERMVDELGD